nr:hypothetical protein BaRGS_033072 [Batillaria attramentaria]
MLAFLGGFSLPRSLKEVDYEKRKHDGDGIVKLRYRPKYQGQYAVHVLWDGEDIPDSPFMVNIEPAADFKAEEVDAWGPGLKSDGVVAGKRCTFTIDAGRAGKAELAVQCIDEDQEPVDVEVKDNEDGTYSCSYVPVKLHRHIMYITYGGKPDNKELQ